MSSESSLMARTLQNIPMANFILPISHKGKQLTAMLGPWSHHESTALRRTFQIFPELAPRLSAQGLKAKTPFLLPKADRETVKMSWHFVLFCVINCSFHSSWPWGSFK